MLVKTRYPGLSVVLFKNVARQKLSGSGANSIAVSTRYAGQNSVLDVTRYVGERGSVHVSKSVREPSGTFQIEFTDQLVPSEDDSIYGLFEPMDMVEIRMAANSYLHSGAVSTLPTAPVALAPTASPTSPLPIMMRGFISRVTRSMVMGSDGKPARKVTISGKDYGKIWEIYQIYFNPWMPDGNNYITQFPLFTRFGIAFGTQSAGELIRSIFDKIVNPFIQTMKQNSQGTAPANTSPLTPLSLDVQIEGGSVAPFGVNGFQGGSIYGLLQTYCDTGLWNELFIEDRKDGPYVVYRPNPFLNAGADPNNSSSYIQKNGSWPVTVTEIGADQIVSLEVSRTDQNVANYFWTEAPFYDMNYGFVAKDMAAHGGPKSTFIITDYGNVDPALYGLKRMAETTHQGSPLNSNGGNGTPASQNLKDAGNALTWISDRRGQLYEQNKDNVVFESGAVQLIGNEAVKAGTYLMIRHGNMTSPYYVVSASHSFVPFSGSYSTSALIERGGGFIDRTQRGSGADSPYWAELADAQLP